MLNTYIILIRDFVYVLVDENTLVSFTAYSKNNRNFDGNDIILFDSIISNPGEHFNEHTSSFVCPFDGIYFSSVTFHTGNSVSLHVDIMLDNMVIIRNYAFDFDWYTVGSSVVNFECSAGQSIWIRCGSDGQMWGDPDQMSHFSGFLISRIEH